MAPRRRRSALALFFVPAMSLLMTVVAAGRPPNAAADGGDAHWGGGHQHNGNGTNNHVSAPFNSPNFISGNQQVINANSGGRTVSQQGICKHRSFCKITQIAR
jgi:hypothetical protein